MANDLFNRAGLCRKRGGTIPGTYPLCIAKSGRLAAGGWRLAISSWRVASGERKNGRIDGGPGTGDGGWKRRGTGDGRRVKSGRVEDWTVEAFEPWNVWRGASGGWRVASTSCHELSKWPD
jgi:hypothetical protein